MLLQFQQCAELEQISIAAYCFMPTHLHLLTCGLTPTSNSWRFICSAKQKTGFWYSRTIGRRLWQRYVWDRVLRARGDSADVVRYILMNPVEAALTIDPFSYPFSGSMVYSRDELRELLAERAPMQKPTEASMASNCRQTEGRALARP